MFFIKQVQHEQENLGSEEWFFSDRGTFICRTRDLGIYVIEDCSMISLLQFQGAHRRSAMYMGANDRVA